MKKYNSELISNARELRRDMTKEERHLWYDFLRQYPIKFTRQKVLGHYIADFYCASAGLVIELDGSQHYMRPGKEYDERRTNYLQGFHIRVIRISNADINGNFHGVCAYLDHVIKEMAERNGK